MFSKAQKTKTKKGKESDERLCLLQEEERSVLACQRRRFYDCLEQAPVIGCCSAMTSAPWAPKKKPHTLKLKSSQLNSTGPDPVAEARCAPSETQINTCWELVFYRDNLWLCMPGSKNTPPQGAWQTRNIPASLEPWEHRGGKDAEEDRKLTAWLSVVLLYAARFCRGRCFNWRWVMWWEEEFMPCFFYHQRKKKKFHLSSNETPPKKFSSNIYV